MAKDIDDREPNPIDIHVGRRVRQRRKSMGVTQEKLADALSLTFQQVQKYERGANRVSASKLYEIARTLQTPIEFFFEGLRDPAEGAAADAGLGDRRIDDFLMTSEGVELADAWPQLPSRLRRRLLDLVNTMAATNAGGIDVDTDASADVEQADQLQ